MGPVSDLPQLLATMTPRLNDGVYVYVSAPAGMDAAALAPIASFREDEGLSLVVEESAALQAGLPIAFRAAWITLTVHSDLQAVGLTAAIAVALTEANISCNVIAAVHHDHLFVPLASAGDAMQCLRALQLRSAWRMARPSSAQPSGAALRGIAYVSTAIVPMLEAELEALLVEARYLNRQSGVTGVLLYNDGNFLQYFEGPDEAMSVVYERIRTSRRHKNIIELLNEPIAARSFADWQMGYARPTRAVLLALSSARWELQAGRARGGDDISAGMSLLLSFWVGTRY